MKKTPNEFMDANKFEYRTNTYDFLKTMSLSYLFKRITSKSMRIFLRGTDNHGIHPQIMGVYEPELTAFINYLSINGFSDFFIDIGANIGLTSIQNGDKFAEVHMFEPNPLCCHILEVNSKIALRSAKYFINNYGLGELDKTVNLTVPRHNWGGAHIRDSANLYNESTLAQKDGFRSYEEFNYFDIEITVKNAANELRKLFDQLLKNGLKRGVIKIDVEGYELVVLKGIADSLPNDFKVYIVFESWSPNLDITQIIDSLQGRASVSKLYRHNPYKKSWPKFLKFFSLMFNWHLSTTLEKINDANFSGDIVIKVE